MKESQNPLHQQAAKVPKIEKKADIHPHLDPILVHVRTLNQRAKIKSLDSTKKKVKKETMLNQEGKIFILKTGTIVKKTVIEMKAIKMEAVEKIIIKEEDLMVEESFRIEEILMEEEILTTEEIFKIEETFREGEILTTGEVLTNSEIFRVKAILMAIGTILIKEMTTLMIGGCKRNMRETNIRPKKNNSTHQALQIRQPDMPTPKKGIIISSIKT
jgi:hypothetical protein